MKLKLAEKITSSEALDKVVTFCAMASTLRSIFNGRIALPLEVCSEVPWWIKRELLRIEHGVYQVTGVTDALNNTFNSQYVVHVSREDSNMIAFTPTIEMGVQDRQLKMSIGKFMRKYFLLWTDAQIQKMEAAHRAEISGVFEVATTEADISYVYRNMEGDSGCMRHPAASYNESSQHHPSAVYEAPGMGVAYTKDSEGTIKSRAVVWVNPAKPEDKRYVRIYGDPVLRRLLERAGYKAKNLVGAKFKAVPLENVENTYVFPYLDGINGDQSQYDGSYIVKSSDEWFTCLSSSQANKVISKFGTSYAVRVKTTAGRLIIKTPSGLSFRSDFSGKMFSELESSKCNYLHDSEIKIAASSEVEACDDYIKMTTIANDEEISVYAPISTPNFEVSYKRYLDTITNRETLGFRKLSVVYYPNADWWRNCILTSDGYIKSTDALQVLPFEGEMYFVHLDKLKELRKLSFANCYTHLEIKRVIHKMRPTLARSVTGTVFDTDTVHPYAKVWGTNDWVNERKTRSHRYITGVYTVLKDQPFKLSQAERVKEIKKSETYIGIDAQITAGTFGSSHLSNDQTLDRHFASLLTAASCTRFTVENDIVLHTYRDVTRAKAQQVLDKWQVEENSYNINEDTVLTYKAMLEVFNELSQRLTTPLSTQAELVVEVTN